MIGAHKKSTTVALSFVLAFQLLTGTGFFCAVKFSHVSRPLGNPSATFAADLKASPEVASEDGWDGSVNQRESVPCSCKKHKKCPTIPRLALISYPIHRFAEVERLTKGDCRHLAFTAKDYRFALRDGPPYLELESGGPIHSSSPLEATCVLLI